MDTIGQNPQVVVGNTSLFNCTHVGGSPLFYTQGSAWPSKPGARNDTLKFSTMADRALQWVPTQDTATPEQDSNYQYKWIKNLSDGISSQPERSVRARSLNRAVTSHLPVAEVITETETAIGLNCLLQPEAEQLRLMISESLPSARPPPSNLLSRKKRPSCPSAKTRRSLFFQ